MKYLTRSQLDSFSVTAKDLVNEALENTKAASHQPGVTLFLSHSHKDKDVVFKVKKFLLSQGVSVFIDWMDGEMPEVTSGETARKIKAKIEEHTKFVVLVTENSKSSKWVPWELGYADRAKGIDNVLIIPISENDREFSGVEYLQIYYSLELYQQRWIVWSTDPVKLVNLVDWLKA